MKEYFKNSRKRAVFAPWLGPLGAAEAPLGCIYTRAIPAAAAAAAAAGRAAAAAEEWGVIRQEVLHADALAAVGTLVETQRRNYTNNIIKSSEKTYCVLCEKQGKP